MALPQFSAWGVDGVALNTFGLTNGEQLDEMSVSMFGLIFPTAAIWNLCAIIDDTVWTACTTYGATWTPASVISNTVWVNGATYGATWTVAAGVTTVWVDCT